MPVRYDASDHSKIAVDVPSLEAEFQRSQANAEAEAEEASRIARSEAKLAGAAGNTAVAGSPTDHDIPPAATPRLRLSS